MDNEIQDKYMDAVLAMLMDEYAEAEAEVLLQKSKEEISEEDVPEELDQKCQALIRRKFAQKRRRHALKVVGNISRRVAVFAIVLLGAFSALFLTVDAVRTPVINFYLKNIGNHSVLIIGSSEQQTKQEIVGDGFAGMLVNGLAELLPPGYSLTEGHFDKNGIGFAYFTDKGTSEINLNITKGDSIFAVDTEDYDRCEILPLAGSEGYYIEKEDRKTVVWMSSAQDRILSLVSNTFDKESLLQLVTHLQDIEE